MKKQLLFLTFIVISHISVLAQNDWLITANGDSLVGNIDVKKFKTIEFTSKQQSKKTFKPSEIRNCWSKGVLYKFAKVSYNTTSQSNLKITHTSAQPVMMTDEVLLQVLINGKLSLYYFKEEDDKIHYFLEKDDKLEELIVVKFVRDANPSRVLVNELYKKTFENFLSDCQSITKDWSIPFEEKSFKSIVNSYNNKCGFSDYSAQDLKSKFRYGLQAGIGVRRMTLISRVGFLEDETYISHNISAGMNMQYSPSRFQKNWYYDFGFSMTRLPNLPVRFLPLIRLEATANYRFNKGKISPILIVGYALERDQDASALPISAHAPVLGLNIPFGRSSIDTRLYFSIDADPDKFYRFRAGSIALNYRYQF